MNKFITIALFALCATLAQGQVIYPYNNLLGNIYSQQNGGASSGSDASASASAQTSSGSNSANNGVISSNIPSLISPYASIAGPVVNALPYGAPIIAGGVVPQGFVNPLVGPIVPQGYVSQIGAPIYPQGYPVGPVGPCAGQGIVF